MLTSPLAAETIAQGTTFTPSTDAVAGSIPLSAAIGVLPLVAFFVFLMVLKWKAHISAIGSVVVAILVAIFAFGMPTDMAFLSLSQGIAFGIFPVIYIIWMAVWTYDLTVSSGRFEDMRVIFSKIGRGDMRIQAMLIAFAFGSLLEALAGFGAPIAIVGAMLLAIGMKPLKAVIVTLVANAAPVAFGAMAIPVTTGAKLAGLDATTLAAISGRNVALIALIVPFLLLVIMDGLRGLRQCWPMAIVLCISFAGAQFLTSSYFTYELTDVVACLASLSLGLLFLRFWGPKTPEEQTSHMHLEHSELDPRRTALALFPYVLIIVVFSLTKLWTLGVNVPKLLASTDLHFQWPGLAERLFTVDGHPSSAANFTFNWLSSPGTILFFCGLVTMLVYSFAKDNDHATFNPRVGLAQLFIGLNRMKWSYVTIFSVMGLAYVMNLSGQTSAIGAFLASTGAAFPLISPVLGWLGTFVTGSATSSNALFAQMQVQSAHTIGVPDHLLVGANTAGAPLGKMVSPQTVALAAATVHIEGRESEILGHTFRYSLGLLIFLGIVVYLQAQGFLGFMVP